VGTGGKDLASSHKVERDIQNDSARVLGVAPLLRQKGTSQIKTTVEFNFFTSSLFLRVETFWISVLITPLVRL